LGIAWVRIVTLSRLAFSQRLALTTAINLSPCHPESESRMRFGARDLLLTLPLPLILLLRSLCLPKPSRWSSFRLAASALYPSCASCEGCVAQKATCTPLPPADPQKPPFVVPSEHAGRFCCCRRATRDLSCFCFVNERNIRRIFYFRPLRRKEAKCLSDSISWPRGPVHSGSPELFKVWLTHAEGQSDDQADRGSRKQRRYYGFRGLYHRFKRGLFN
jgi:hypothetical protein